MKRWEEKIKQGKHWFTNIRDYEMPTFRQLANLVELPFEEEKPAYNIDGTILNEATSIFVPQEAYDKGLLTKYTYVSYKFREQYKQRLLKNGYDITPLLNYDKSIFFGCENYYHLEKGPIYEDILSCDKDR